MPLSAHVFGMASHLPPITAHLAAQIRLSGDEPHLVQVVSNTQLGLVSLKFGQTLSWIDAVEYRLATQPDQEPERPAGAATDMIADVQRGA